MNARDLLGQMDKQAEQQTSKADTPNQSGSWGMPEAILMLLFGGLCGAVGLGIGSMNERARILPSIRELPQIGISFDDASEAVTRRDFKILDRKDLDDATRLALDKFCAGGSSVQNIVVKLPPRPVDTKETPPAALTQ